MHNCNEYQGEKGDLEAHGLHPISESTLNIQIHYLK